MKRIDYSEREPTVERIREMYPVLRSMPSLALELMWKHWSDEKYFASCMMLDDELVKDFYEWLFEDL